MSLYADDFSDNTASGFGVADIGGTWVTVGATTPANGRKSGGMGLCTIDSGSYFYALPVSVADAEVLVRFQCDTDPTAGAQDAYMLIRYMDVNNYYAVKLSWQFGQTHPRLRMRKTVAGSVTEFTDVHPARETQAKNVWYWVRFQVQGSPTATLRARVWQDGTNEPTGWDTETTDTTPALAGPGGVALRYNFDAGTPPNFTISTKDLSGESIAPTPIVILGSGM